MTTTGYGEALLMAALKATSARSRPLRTCAATSCRVDFILDIGGQDMKCLRVKDGVIEHIMLNEAARRAAAALSRASPSL